MLEQVLTWYPLAHPTPKNCWPSYLILEFFIFYFLNSAEIKCFSEVLLLNTCWVHCTAIVPYMCPADQPWCFWTGWSGPLNFKFSVEPEIHSCGWSVSQGCAVMSPSFKSLQVPPSQLADSGDICFNNSILGHCIRAYFPPKEDLPVAPHQVASSWLRLAFST